MDNILLQTKMKINPPRTLPYDDKLNQVSRNLNCGRNVLFFKSNENHSLTQKFIEHFQYLNFTEKYEL
jgi:hypothetical protein